MRIQCLLFIHHLLSIPLVHTFLFLKKLIIHSQLQPLYYIFITFSVAPWPLFSINIRFNIWSHARMRMQACTVRSINVSNSFSSVSGLFFFLDLTVSSSFLCFLILFFLFPIREESLLLFLFRLYFFCFNYLNYFFCCFLLFFFS